MLFQFVGESYVYRSTSFDNQRSINLYPASSETGNSKGDFILCPTPGRQIYLTLPSAPIRGFYVTSTGRAFIVAYNILYEILAVGNYTPRGNLLTYTGNVSMSDNGLQLIIVDGTPTGGWIFDLSSAVFSQITAMGFPGGTTVCFLDGYFVINTLGSNGNYQWSALYDGTLWDATDFANAEGSPDALICVVSLHRQIYLLGSETIEVIYDSGANIDPFQNVQGVFIQYGTNYPFSVQAVANTIFWVGNDRSGTNVVWMANGYQPERISTQAIEYYLSQYDLTNTTTLSYQEDGHYFYQINVPTAPTSLIYDITNKQWHERARWNPSSARYERDRANFHGFAFGKHLVTDYENGNVYEQSLNFNKDDDFLIKRSRTLPYFTDDLEYLYFSKFQIDMQTGIGLETDSNPANTDPQGFLRWSDDSGKTWSTEIAVSLGKVGEYRTRALWHRLGRSRFRIFEFSTVADVPIYLIAAHLDVSKGYA